MFDSVPNELKKRPQWVLWRWELNGQRVQPKTPKATKVPYNAHNGRKSSSTNPRTWASFDEAASAVKAHHCDGIGFVFAADDPYTGIDLDDCMDDTQTIAPWAWNIVQTMQTYTEISPSGRGLKLWVIGNVSESVKTDQIEIYSQARYFTVTGDRLANTPGTIRDVNGSLESLYQSLQKPAKVAEPRLTTAVDDTYLRVWADRVIESAVDKMKHARDGERHNTRFAMGRLLGGLIHLGLMNEDRAFRLLYDSSTPDANDPTERKAITDGIADGCANPLTPPPPPPQPLMQDGIALCPVHKTKLPPAKNGNGYKCHERDTTTISGWCDFWWKGEGYIPPASAATLAVVTAAARLTTDYVLDWRKQGVTLAELQHKVFDPEKWIIENVLPEGACLLAAKYKSKKSWMALALSLAVAMGGRALGRLLTAPGRVLYLDLEGKQQRIQKRTRAILGVHQIDWPANFHIFTKWPQGDEGIKELEHWFMSYPDTALVVTDVLASFRRPIQKHEEVYRYDRDTIDPLNELAERYHAANLLVHHFNKGKHDDIMDSITGSTGIPSAVNTMWGLTRDPNDSQITVLHLRGRDLENDEPLALRWDSYLNQHVIEGPANEVAISTERRAILRVMSDDKPRTPKEIATELERPVTAIQFLLRKLLNEGSIDKVGYGKYAVVAQSAQTPQSAQSFDADSEGVLPTLRGTQAPPQSLSSGPGSGQSANSEYSEVDLKGTPIDAIPEHLRPTTRMMLVSDLERNQETARQRCEAYGIDFETARNWARTLQ